MTEKDMEVTFIAYESEVIHNTGDAIKFIVDSGNRITWSQRSMRSFTEKRHVNHSIKVAKEG